MPRPRFARLTPERQQEIVDKAAAAFAAAGYEGTSYNALIASLGLSKGSAYHMFDGKADLYGEVLRRALDELTAWAPTAIQTAPGFWRAVAQWLADAAAKAAARPDIAALLHGYLAVRATTAIVEVDQALDDVGTAPLRTLLAAGLRVGAVRSDLPLELLVNLANTTLAALDRHYLPSLQWARPATTAKVLAVYLDTLKRLLQRRR